MCNWFQARPDEPEELDFMFDEELDQLGGGRRNTFSEWSVTASSFGCFYAVCFFFPAGKFEQSEALCVVCNSPDLFSCCMASKCA